MKLKQASEIVNGDEKIISVDSVRVYRCGDGVWSQAENGDPIDLGDETEVRSLGNDECETC